MVTMGSAGSSGGSPEKTGSDVLNPGRQRAPGKALARVPLRDRPAGRAAQWPRRESASSTSSPLKGAFNYDVERNLRGPLAGLGSALRVGVRTGDTPAAERRELVREPPDILITTPESLYLLLTSSARETLRLRRGDAHPRRGARSSRRANASSHLALSVERASRWLPAETPAAADQATLGHPGASARGDRASSSPGGRPDRASSTPASASSSTSR